MVSLGTPHSLLLARRELALARRQVELQRENALFFYRPHPKQELFHNAAGFKFRYARTGNRFGKSEMGAAEDVAYALGYRPWITEDDPRRTLGIPQHPTKGMIVCVSWKKTREIFTETEQGNLGKLWKYIPKACLISTSKNHSGFIDRFVVKHVSGGRSVIMLATVEGFKNNELDQESSVHDWVHIDEPIPRAMWVAIVRGLTDRNGSAWFTCTPLSEPWIDEMFIPEVEDQSKDSDTTISDEELSRWMMTGSMDDNPSLSADSIRLTMSNYTPDEQEARRHGIPAAYAGLVYKECSPADHFLKDPPPGWSDWLTPPDDYTIRLSIDYHFRKNDAILFIATSPQEISYVFHEIWEQILIAEEVKRIKAILNGRFYMPALIDPLASTPNKINTTNAMDEYRRLGLACGPATKDPVNGIRNVRAILKARDKFSRPVLFFNSACRRTKFEILRGFVYDGDENKPAKKNDDMMECLYRLSLNGLTYIEPSESSFDVPVPADPDDNILDFADPSTLDFGGIEEDKPFSKSRRYAR